VPYFHIVFTLPHELSALALQNKRLLYDLLFRTSTASLLELARDSKHLGAAIGFLAVLHTWGQNLQVHPHVHYIVPAGALALDGSKMDRFLTELFPARQGTQPSLPPQVQDGPL
jgi:hypothetical protein